MIKYARGDGVLGGRSSFDLMVVAVVTCNLLAISFIQTNEGVVLMEYGAGKGSSSQRVVFGQGSG